MTIKEAEWKHSELYLSQQMLRLGLPEALAWNVNYHRRRKMKVISG